MLDIYIYMLVRSRVKYLFESKWDLRDIIACARFYHYVRFHPDFSRQYCLGIGRLYELSVGAHHYCDVKPGAEST